jgi:hypothetical protein
MLWKARDLIGYGMHASDGSLGTISDLLFDDREWTVRWVVADTGTWLSGRKVLLPPQAFGDPSSVNREVTVDLARQQIEDAPGIETDQPVSRQMESDLHRHYGYAPYWAGAYGMPLATAGPAAIPPIEGSAAPSARSGVPAEGPGAAPMGDYPEEAEARRGDPHLRSANEVIGYYIEATDGDIGHVEDIMVEIGSWRARYLMIDTKNWWPGRMVLISPDWATSVSWEDQKVFLDHTREQVRGSPEYDPDRPVDRSYEERLHGYYGYGPYWAP